MIKKICIFLLPLFVSTTLFAQLQLKGHIVNDDSLAIARVKITNNGNSTMTDVHGFFQLAVNDSIGTLKITKNGFLEKTYSYNLKDATDIVVALNTIETNQIETVTIKATPKYKNKKENPAFAILQKVWDKHYSNAFDSYKNYSYEEYQKIEASLNNIDSAFAHKKIFRGMEFMFKSIDTATTTGKTYVPVFLSEAIYNYYKQNSPESREKRVLVAEKASGFEGNDLFLKTIQSLYKNFNIYDNTLNFFDKGYVSPLSTGGFGVYDYTLMKDQIIEGEPCYTIKYTPKNNSALVFRGVLYISKDSYAVKNVTLNSVKNSNINFVRGINVDLTYKILDENSFIPTKSIITLDMSLTNKKENAKGMYMTRSISYTNFQFNQPSIEQEVKKKEEPNYDEAYSRSEEFWASKRQDSLTSKNTETYANLERLWKVPRFKTAVNLVGIIGSGYINAWNAIDFGSLYSVYGHNDVEGNRIRVGARTYFSRNDMWRIEGYTAYGFRDEKFKYGVEGRYMFNKLNRFTLGVSSRSDIIQMGSQLIQTENIMDRAEGSSSIVNRGNNTNLSKVNENHVYATIEPFKNFRIKLDGSYQELKSADENLFKIDYLQNGVLKNQVNNAKVDLELLYKPSAIYSQYGVDRYEHTTLSPTFLLNISKGIKGAFNSDFEYTKVQFSYVQPFLFGSLGLSEITFDVGKTFGTVPLSLMTTLPGNQAYTIRPKSFAQLNYYEFVVDSYATLFYEHNFNGYLFNKIPFLKTLKLREIVFFRGAWGSLRHDNQLINRSTVIYMAPKDHIYYEYGFGIGNIGFGNFRFFRLDFNWRGNYLDHPDASPFGVKFGIELTF